MFVLSQYRDVIRFSRRESDYSISLLVVVQPVVL